MIKIDLFHEYQGLKRIFGCILGHILAINMGGVGAIYELQQLTFLYLIKICFIYGGQTEEFELEFFFRGVMAFSRVPIK